MEVAVATPFESSKVVNFEELYNDYLEEFPLDLMFHISHQRGWWLMSASPSSRRSGVRLRTS